MLIKYGSTFGTFVTVIAYGNNSQLTLKRYLGEFTNSLKQSAVRSKIFKTIMVNVKPLLRKIKVPC